MTTSKPSNPKDSCGIKKVPHSTIPSGVIGELGLAMLEGARKYGRHNYRVISVLTSVYYDAAKRHLDAFWEGQDTDPDSKCGLSHITKAIASLTVLRDAQMMGTCVDDRPPPLPEGWQDRLNEMAAALIEHYPDPKEAFTHENIRLARPEGQKPEQLDRGEGRSRTPLDDPSGEAQEGRVHW